ncbi:MAG TPA: CCA tRNA nucleotidyltransferase [Gemmatimonadaceae bacterium]|nr:CCA tRNA nucleotidyltransferase [Gemmatimonadaceae bacterium]
MNKETPGSAGRLRPSGAVLDIAKRLENAGFETWCVGGAVRDALLGHPHLDWDLATAATPQQVRRLFRRTIPVGIEFGTVGVLDDRGVMHEVTTFRRDVKTDGRHAVVEFGASLDDDLARRDFTINAIAWSPSRKELRDPFGGEADLRARIVRAVGVPEERMREDRLRALRAIRFASRFGFEIEPATWAAIVASAPHLRRLSMERVKQELEKTMEQVECPSSALRLWRDSGALQVLIPSLANISDVALGAMDEVARPVPAEGAAGVGRPDRRMNRFVALFSDLEPEEAGRTLRALRFSNADIAWITSVLARWRVIEGGLRAALPAADHAGSGATTPPPAAVVRRLVGAAGRTRVRAVLRLAAARFSAERKAGREAPSSSSMRALYRAALRTAFRDPVEIGDLAVDGDDLRKAGIPPGPALGKVLARLLEDVLEDPARNTSEWLVPRARELYAQLEH